MKRLNNIKIFRLIIQILFLILLPGLISMTFLSAKAIFIDIINNTYTSFLTDSLMFILVSLLTMVMGRFFCGWICIFGLYKDFIYMIGNKVFKIKYKVNKTLDICLKYAKYLVLILIISLVWTSIITLPSDIMPWDILMSLFTITNIGTYIIGLIILLLVTIGSLFIERFFCRYLCPLGAIFSILSKLRIIKIGKERSVCGLCKACSLNCPMGIDLNNTDLVSSGECINCFRCVGICPKNNAKVVIDDKKVNEYAVTLVALSAFSGLYIGSNSITSNSNMSSNEVDTTNTDNTTTTDTSTNTSSSTSTGQIYKDGTYIGTGTGYRPNLKLSVTIENDKIVNITVYSSNETANFFNKACTTIKNAIIAQQSTNVDTVSGATRSSNGIIAAVKDALSQAKIEK